MKGVFRKYLTPAAALALLAAAVAYAESPKIAAVSHMAVENKLTYCRTCHGASGQGFPGAFTMPRLAGQQPEYIESQLKAFLERRRANPIMGSVARALSPEMVKALSRKLHDLDPDPLGAPATTELTSEGKTIYENGVQSANIPPCASCHGADAKGDGPIPRLAGQLNNYIFRTLSNWKNERGQKPADSDSSAIMHPTAQSFTPHQIAAVAAYVSRLK
jgi:cytochrome c553